MGCGKDSAEEIWVAINAYIKKDLKSITNFTSLGDRKDEQTKPNSSRRKEIIEIKEFFFKQGIEKKTVPKINKTKVVFFF